MLQSSAYAINEHKTDAQKQKNEQLEAEMHFFRQGFLFREMSTFSGQQPRGGGGGEEKKMGGRLVVLETLLFTCHVP